MILILTQCFPSRIGGIENLMFNLSYFLAKYNKVVVLADQNNIIKDAVFDNKFKNNFLVRRFGGLKYFRRRNKLRELEKIITFQDIEVVICDSWKSLELPIKNLQKKNLPSICLVHGNEVIIKNKNHQKRIKNTLKSVNKIVTNSEYTKNLLKKVSLEFNNIEIIHPGVSTFENIKEEELSLSDGQPTLLTLARLEKRKGHENILHAISNLKNQFPKIRYIIAGDGIEKKNLQLLVNKLGISKNVIFIGSVSDQQKKYILNITDLMIMPTIDKTNNLSIEGFGIAYIEAALFGIPSIASNNGGTNEAVIHDKTGIVLEDISDLEDSIRELILNREKRQLYGKNAQLRAINELHWDHQVKKYLNLISNIKIK